MTEATVARRVLEAFAQAGVHRAFGLPGVHISRSGRMPGRAALAVTGAASASVGANVITDILQAGIDRLRTGDDRTVGELEGWLDARFTELLDREDRQAIVLRGQLAAIFGQIGASLLAQLRC